MYNFYTNLASAASFTIPDPCTLSFWYILRGYNLVRNNILGTATNWRTHYNVGSGKIDENFNQTLGGSSTTSPAVGARIHLAFAIQRSTQGRLYYNGVEESNNSGASIPTSPTTLGIGGRPTDTECANGDLEDIRVYNRILTAREIKDIYFANGRDFNISGLLNRWGVTSQGNGQDMSGATLYDLIGKLSATVTGTGAFYRGGYCTPRRRV